MTILLTKLLFENVNEHGEQNVNAVAYSICSPISWLSGELYSVISWVSCMVFKILFEC